MIEFIINILCEQGFSKPLAKLAVQRAGADVDQAIDFCVAYAGSVPEGISFVIKLLWVREGL